MTSGISRRELIKRTGAALGAGLAATAVTSNAPAAGETNVKAKNPFRYCLNMSTLQEPWGKSRKITVPEEIDIAAKAGFEAIELWVNEIDDYAKGGGSLKD